MINYRTVTVTNLKDNDIEKAYMELLDSKDSFTVIKVNEENYILTKEYSFFKVENLEVFIEEANKDLYFKTVESKNHPYLEEDLKLYFKYLNQYKKQMTKRFGKKYLFGCVAVKTTNNQIITTIREKEDFEEFTIITDVDYDNRIIYVNGKKATLNAPLLYNLLKNDGIKAIVHCHHYDAELYCLPYAFPGTLKDSLREVTESFQISSHGVFMLFDEKGKMIRRNENE